MIRSIMRRITSSFLSPAIDRRPLSGGMRLMGVALTVYLGLGGCSLIREFGADDPGPAEPGQVLLRWKADSRFSGFNVHRTQPNGTRVKVNSSPVKPLATAESGIVPYEFVDRGLIAGQSYYYLFEEIGPEGRTRVWETPRRAIATPIP